jgi:hypothetical protein
MVVMLTHTPPLNRAGLFKQWLDNPTERTCELFNMLTKQVTLKWIEPTLLNVHQYLVISLSTEGFWFRASNSYSDESDMLMKHDHAYTLFKTKIYNIC